MNKDKKGKGKLKKVRVVVPETNIVDSEEDEQSNHSKQYDSDASVVDESSEEDNRSMRKGTKKSGKIKVKTVKVRKRQPRKGPAHNYVVDRDGVRSIDMSYENDQNVVVPGKAFVDLFTTGETEHKWICKMCESEDFPVS